MKKILSYFLFLILLNNCIFSQTTESKIISDSQREIYIQKANKLRANEDFLQASYYLDSILIYNQKDAPILLYKGDLMLQAKLFAKAAEVYKKIIPLQYEKTIVKINLSYALFMSHKTVNALKYAKDAWNNDNTNTNAIVNYFNALLWNIKTKEAETFLNIQKQNLQKHQTFILKARLFTTKGNFRKGLMYYDSAVNANDSKFYVQEFAEVLIGKKEYKKASIIIENNKSKFLASEYNNLILKLNTGKDQYTGTEFSYFTDVAQNIRFENKYWWQQAAEKKYQLNIAAGFGSIKSANNLQSNTQFSQVQVNENWSSVLKGESKINIQKITSNTENSFIALTAQQTIKYQPNDRQMIGLYVKRELLNFTSSLLDQRITSTGYGYITHLMLNDKLGFFSEGNFTNISDNNNRMQFFGSLYKLFRTEPTLKTGLNFTALHFSDSSIKNYFSPNQYLHTELFVDFSTPLPQINNFFLQLQAATGFQKIEVGNWEAASRFQAEIGYRKNRFETVGKFQTSNVSSNNGTGYSFYWYTLNLRYKL
ncbi:MAG: tetratricopeptide repeat protein [Chitinophagaceae bacterium]